jgi:hypothetical protein
VSILLSNLSNPNICPPGGGCVLPVFAKQKRGTDCTGITGVLDVSCIASTCVVHTCKDGFVVTDDESTCLPVLALQGRDTTTADGNVSSYVGDLVSSVNLASTFDTKVVSRKATSTSTLSLGTADTALKLSPETLASLVAADDPFAVLAKAYTAVHAPSKRESSPTPIISSTIHPVIGIEGLVLVDSP